MIICAHLRIILQALQLFFLWNSKPPNKKWKWIKCHIHHDKFYQNHDIGRTTYYPCFDPNILKIRLVLISPNCLASWIELFWRYNINQKSPQIARYRPISIIAIVLFLRLLYCHFIALHLKSDHVVGSVCVLNAVLSLCCLPQRVLENRLSCLCRLVRGWV